MHEMIKKTEHKCDELCRLKDKLMSWVTSETEKGRAEFDTKEAGDVVDMIKDLAEAEEKCWKACYYASVTKYMQENYGDEDENDRAGYDHFRYPSSGRFASTGHGRRYGFTPHMPLPTGLWETPMRDPMEYDMDDYTNPRMGYTGNKDDRDVRTNSMHMRNNHSGRYGYSYENYRDRRRNYTDSHNQKDKEEMDTFAQEHISDTITTMRDIWHHADPDLKSRMKTDLSNLIGEMNS